MCLFLAIYKCKKGVEIGLPISVLCHLAKSILSDLFPQGVSSLTVRAPQGTQDLEPPQGHGDGERGRAIAPSSVGSGMVVSPDARMASTLSQGKRLSRACGAALPAQSSACWVAIATQWR